MATFKNVLTKHSHALFLSLAFLFLGCGSDFGSLFDKLGNSSNCGVRSLLEPPNDFSLLSSCISAPTTLFVFDTNNNRALVFDIRLISDGENAVNVLGQSSFTSSTAATTQAGLSIAASAPAGQSSLVGQYLYVPDTNNHRIMVWDVNSITDGENAAYVLGQSDFTSSAAPAPTPSSLNTPLGLDLDTSNNRLFVADQSNARVLVFDVSSISNGKNAVNVLGKPDFTTGGSSTTQSGMGAVKDTAYDSKNNRLFASDRGNHRIIVFDVASITDGESAVNVLGQANFTSGSANRGGTAAQNSLNFPTGLAYADPYLYVADTDNNRVLVFDVDSITDGENAAYVLGQPNFTTTSCGTTAAKMCQPWGGLTVDTFAKKLYTVDLNNNRVLIFDITTITSSENAVNVLGQSSFTSSTAATTQSGMNAPSGVSLK